MLDIKQAVIQSGLETLYFTGAHRGLRSFIGGVGAILTLHHVRPPRNSAFQPNRLLEISPAFLEAAIVRLRQMDVDLISLDEMYRRMTEGDYERRFVCFTLDDGYRDNRLWAYPIFSRHDVPFAIYVPTSFPEGQGDLWWLTLEQVIAQKDEVVIRDGREEVVLPCRTPAEKQAAFTKIYWDLRALPSEAMMRQHVAEFAERHAVDVTGICADLAMTWDEIADLARDPLVTIGAHTVNHLMLAKCDDEHARGEMRESADAIERVIGRRPRHFSFPIGDASAAGPREFALAAELGFDTAMTTRPGVLFPEHAHHLTALPRISLNGQFQRMRYFDVLVSGAATAVWNRFRRVNAA
ncbi:MAG: hypothetical protein QOD74_1033 [Variibacter sp.]|jgi:peptidoglycan/xylan/chitin deacetylase (PgdA/CDA1 family)|nr:hypothetical protein [Variibacter sp.]